MKHIKYLTLILVISFLSCKYDSTFDLSTLTTLISSENSWKTDNGILSTYFYTEKSANLPFGIIAEGPLEIDLEFNDKTKQISISEAKVDTIFVGAYLSHGKGYNRIDLKHNLETTDISKKVKGFVFEKQADSTNLKYLKDDFYFGRRGPSTHLVFDTPTTDIEWMYSEIEIDPSQDVIGSYFMANGFGEGYFGIQVNSETERRILFSIWSPFKTDDPKSIPEDQRIQLLNKGEGVTTGEFGNEGSGGQSYKVFNWSAGTRYGFLTQVKPNGDNTTNYTAYFHDPETQQWHLIASFKRPQTNSYVTRPYSFLENFIPEMGNIKRRGGFYNQWMRDRKGQWHEITEAKFSADATARKDARLDYSGGTENSGFYLQNCGFTGDLTPIGTPFKRNKGATPPNINFEALE